MTLRLALILVLLSISPGFAQQVDEHLAQVKVRVTDEAGVPVARARIMLSTYTSWVPGRRDAGRDEYNTALGFTDANGLVALSLKGSSGRYGCVVLPMPEFHWDRGKEYVFTNSAAGRWEPWEPLVSIVLKRKAVSYSPADALAGTNKPVESDVSKDPMVAKPGKAGNPGRP